MPARRSNRQVARTRSALPLPPSPTLSTQGSKEALAAPIILDLDGDGRTIAELAGSRVAFDMAGDGRLYRTAWLDDGDAFLVRDRNGDGMITDINEISFVGDKVGARTDLEGLASFDSNGDGVLNADDEGFVAFGVWRDGNANGRVDAGELQSLAEAKIASISVAGTATGKSADGRSPGESVVFNTGEFTYVDGKTGKLADVGLAYSTVAVGAVGSTALTFQSLTMPQEHRAKSYRLSATGGGLSMRLRKLRGEIDPGAGRLAAATLLQFADQAVGVVSPIILDLDGDGLELVSRRKARAAFDLDGDGRADDTGWIGNGDGLLVIDRDNDGRITTAAELSFLGEKPDATSAFDALATLDANRDGRLDGEDARFAELKVWVDANRDGITDAGELRTLAEAGIASLSLRSTALSGIAKPGQNLDLATAAFTRIDGSTATMGEAALAFTPSSLESAARAKDELAGMPSTPTEAASAPSEQPDMAAPSFMTRPWPQQRMPELDDPTRAEDETGDASRRDGASALEGLAPPRALASGADAALTANTASAALAATRLAEAMTSFGVVGGVSEWAPLDSDPQAMLSTLAPAR